MAVNFVQEALARARKSQEEARDERTSSFHSLVREALERAAEKQAEEARRREESTAKRVMDTVGVGRDFLTQTAAQAMTHIPFAGQNIREAYTERGFIPPEGSAAAIVGDILGTTAQFAAAGSMVGAGGAALSRIPQLAQLVARAPAAIQTQRAANVARGVATGAAATALQKTARPDEVDWTDLAQNMAFIGGGALASDLTRAAIASRFPGMHRLAEAGLSGAAAGLGGTLASAPFMDEPLSELPSDALVNAASLALFQTGLSLLTPYQPTAEFIRAGRRASDALHKAREGTQMRRSQQVDAARRDFDAAINEMYHVARRVRTDLPEQMTPEARQQFEAIFRHATAAPTPRYQSAGPAQLGFVGQPPAPAEGASAQAAEGALSLPRPVMVLHRFSGRPVTRFDLSRLPVEDQLAIKSFPEEHLSAYGITLAEQARTYLENRFNPKYDRLIEAWEQAGVPNTVIADAVSRTDPASLEKRQKALERDGILDLPMYQSGGWVRTRPGLVDFERAQQAFITAGRPVGMVDMTRPPAVIPDETAEDIANRLRQETWQIPSRLQAQLHDAIQNANRHGQNLPVLAEPQPQPQVPMIPQPEPPPQVPVVYEPSSQPQVPMIAPQRPQPPVAASEPVIIPQHPHLVNQPATVEPDMRAVRPAEGREVATAPEPQEAPNSAPSATTNVAPTQAAPAATPVAPEPASTAATPAPTDGASLAQTKFEAIQSALAQGRPLEVRTEYRVTPLSRPEHVRMTPSGDIQILSGREWATLTPPQVDALARMAGMELDTFGYPPGHPNYSAGREPIDYSSREPVAQGSTVRVFTERGTELDAQYALVEAHELVASHDTDLRLDPRFPQELQPRDRSRAASELQINRIVQHLTPEFLGESPKASEGAPIIGPDFIVESGNGRVIALQRAYRDGHQNIERYRQWLADNAQRFGIDRAALEAMDEPVLVRIRRTDLNREQFVREANESSVSAMGAVEQAISDARSMTPELMSRFVPDDEGRIFTRENSAFVSAFLDRVVGPTERSRYMQSDGSISLEGQNRIRNAIFARAYGDPAALVRLAEDPDATLRNVTGALLNAAPRFVHLAHGIERGVYHDMNITTELIEAANKMVQLRNEGTSVSVFLDQTTMFGDDMSDLSRAILEVLDKHLRSRKRMTEILDTYVTMVEALGMPAQSGLFGDDMATPTKDEIFAAAVQEVESRYERRAAGDSGLEASSRPTGSDSAPSLFAQAAPAQQAEGTGRGPERVQRTAQLRGFPESAGGRRVAAHDRPRPSSDEPVITRKQALDYIEKEFLMPIREGRLTLRGSRGEFNLHTHVTRLKRAEDFRAITHEFGHFLSETLPLNPMMYPELQPLGAALYPDADPELQHEEGAAEFFYLYFGYPEAAKAAAPKFYADFEARLREAPEFGAKIRQAQKMFMAQFRQTGTAAVRAAIVREDAKEKPFLNPVERFYTAWVDALHPVFRMMQWGLGEEKVRSEWDVPLYMNPYVNMRLAAGRMSKAHTLLTRAQISPTFERVGPSFKEILLPVSSRIEDFEVYLVAKRAVELAERGINPGIHPEDAEMAVRELENPEFVKAQRQLVAYQDNLVEHLIDAGVLDRGTANSFRKLNRDYVPFYRYFGEESAMRGRPGGGNRIGNLPRPVRSIRGSTRSIMSPLQSIMMNTITMIDIAERNRVGRALAEFADRAKGAGWLIERVPDPMEPNKVVLSHLRKDLLEAGIPKEVLAEADLDRLAVTFRPVTHARFKEGKENILTVYRNGKPEFYQLHPEIYRAVQFLDQPAANMFFRLLSVPSRILRAGAVLNPEFAMRNPTRDQFAALMHRKYRFTPVIDPARALFHLLKGEAVGGDELYDLWQAAGGAQSTLVSIDRDYLEKDLRKLIGQQTALQKAGQVIRSPLTFLEAVSAATEESTRLAQFRSGIEAGDGSPDDIRWAAYASREIAVDFQRAGHLGRQANQVKAFFNAAIQGVDQMARYWKRDPIGYTLRAFLYITIPSVLLYLRNRNDPRYQELPQWRKDLYFVYLTKDSMFFIPKPFELGVMFGTVPERILEWVLENDPEAFEGLEQTLFDTMLPVDPTNPVDWLPDALMPMIEVWANRSAFADRPIIPRGEESLLPEDQYGPHTTAWAKRIGWLLGVSPRHVEHLVTGYGAGLGRQVLRMLDWMTGEESINPVLRPFGGDPWVSAATIDEFYQELDHLEKLSRTARERERRGADAQQIAYDEERLRFLRRVRDDLAAYRRMNRSILESSSFSVEEKRRMTEAITLRMVNLARWAMGKPLIEEPDDVPFVPVP